MATEPKTTVSIIDETIGLGNDPVDTNLNILCPIISPTGPTKLTRVTGPSMLRRYFNGGSAITPNSSQTLQYARAVSAQAPIYVKRACNSTIRGGKTTSFGETFYVDEMGNPITAGVLNFQDNPSPKYADILEELESHSGTSVCKINDTTYITKDRLSTSSEEQYDLNTLVKKASSIETTEENSIKLVGSTTASKITIEVSGHKFTLAAGSTNLDVLVKDIHDQGIEPTAVDGEGASYIDGTSTNVTYVAYDQKVTFTSTELTQESLKFYTNVIYSESEYLDRKICDKVDVVLTVDNTTYQVHTSDIPYDESSTVDIELSNELNYSEIHKALYDGLKSYFELSTIPSASGEFNWLIPGLTSVTQVDHTDQENDPVDPDPVDPQDPETPSEDPETEATVLNGLIFNLSEDSYSAPADAIFGVVSKFPNNLDAITVKSVDNGNKTYTLTVNAFGEEEVFTISFIPGAVDGYGNDLSYTNVEAQSDYISVIPLGGTLTASEIVFKIGSQVTNEFVDVTDLSGILEEMMETEESPVLFDYILDGGIVNKSYSQMILQACEYYKSFYPASCQTDNMSAINMKNNRNNLGSGQQSMRANFIAAAQRDSVLDSGLVTMPASYYYLSTRIGLARSVKEFTAIFGKTNGNIGIINPIKDYKKSDRESMLGQQIVTLKRSMTDGSWYLNLNSTCYGTDSYLQEDGIVLMNNKISQVAMAYAETVKSEYNTPELREKVTGSLTQLINTRLRVGTAYGPNSIRVICDDTNNTKNTIAQRKLIIDIYGRFANTVKDVLIYQHVQPLEG